MSNNGHMLNGEAGAMGAVRPHGHRAYAALLQRMVEKAESLADGEIAKIVTFAVRIRDDETLTPRDRMRASELLTALISKGIDIALYMDKSDRAEGGQATERIVVEYVKSDRILR